MSACVWLGALATTALLLVQAPGAAAAVAPEYRWEIEPDYIAPPPPSQKDDTGLKLGRYSVFMDCDAVCNFTTVYALLSEKPQRKVLTLLVVDPRSLGIELAHHSISGSAPRKPSAEDLDRFGLDPKADPPPHYASYPAVDIELPLVAGPNELVIKQKLPMSTRGRGTDQVVRVMLLNLWSLRSWNKDDDFALYLNYAFGPAAVTQADGLRDNHVEPLCTISGYDYDNMEVPLVGYRDDRTGRVQYPILYRFVLPAMVDCRVGGRSGLRLEAPTNQLRGR